MHRQIAQSMKLHVVGPAARVQGEITVPGDKSISHRALILAGVGVGECRLVNLSSSADVSATKAALRALGVVIGSSQSPVEIHSDSSRVSSSQILVDGRGWDGLQAPSTVLDCANSGTTARSLIGLLGGRPFSSTIDGDGSLRSRPMRRVMEPLSAMGARFEASEGDRLPILMHGGSLRGIAYEMPIASAQVKTALILAGLQAEGETVVIEHGASRDHTERMLEFIGVPITKELNRLIVRPTQIHSASEISIPGDLSSAAFLLVAAAVLPGSDVEVHEVGVNPTRTGILEALERYGAVVEITDRRDVCGEPRATVRVRAGDRRALEIDATRDPVELDELPLVAVMAAAADGETVVTGAAELRVKESDRIAAVVDGLRAIGGAAEALPDGFVVRGGRPLRAGRVESRGDHRIAMAFAVAALLADGPVEIQDWDSVAVSFPGFETTLEGIAVR